MRKTVDLNALHTCQQKTLIAISMSNQNIVRTTNDLITDRFKLQELSAFQVPTGDDVTPQQVDTAVSQNTNSINALRFRWGAYNDYLLVLEDATNAWREWNQSIYEVFTKGLTADAKSKGLTKRIPFIEEKPADGLQTEFRDFESEEGTVYSTQADTLLEYFYQVKAYNAYGRVKAHSGKALDSAKNAQANRAIKELNDIISDASVNAHMAGKVYDSLVTKRTSVASFLDEINMAALRAAALGSYS